MSRYHTYHHRSLALDSRRKKLGGVCAGLARYLGTEPFFIRLAAVISLLVAGHFTLLAYCVAWIVLEER